MPKKLTQEEVINRFRYIHGEIYDYSLVCYKGVHKKVKITCDKEHIFEQTPANHIFRKSKCPICLGYNKSSKQVIDKFKKTHGDRYDYSLVEYKNSTTKVKIICKIDGHGVFEQTLASHLRKSGCPKCGNIEIGKHTRSNTKDFINKSKKIHGNKYDYSMVDYKDAITKVKIICRKHDVFNQRPSDHLQHKGCPQCGVISSAKQKQINPTGWSVTNWEIRSKNSKKFDSFKVYVIKCWNDNEEFYKIGRTFRKTEERFIGFKYNYEIIKEIIFDSAINCFKKEKELKRNNRVFKYLPKVKFNGMHECFGQINL